MNQTGKSMIAIAVTRALRSAEERGDIRTGTGRSGWARYDGEVPGWKPGMTDAGGLGPIPQATIDAVAEAVSADVEKQLAASQAEPQKAAEALKRQRPDWLSVVGEEDADRDMGGDAEESAE
jgi:hypothetical protein